MMSANGPESCLSRMGREGRVGEGRGGAGQPLGGRNWTDPRSSRILRPWRAGWKPEQSAGARVVVGGWSVSIVPRGVALEARRREMELGLAAAATYRIQLGTPSSNPPASIRFPSRALSFFSRAPVQPHLPTRNQPQSKRMAQAPSSPDQSAELRMSG